MTRVTTRTYAGLDGSVPGHGQSSQVVLLGCRETVVAGNIVIMALARSRLRLRADGVGLLSRDEGPPPLLRGAPAGQEGGPGEAGRGGPLVALPSDAELPGRGAELRHLGVHRSVGGGAGPPDWSPHYGNNAVRHGLCCLTAPHCLTVSQFSPHLIVSWLARIDPGRETGAERREGGGRVLTVRRVVRVRRRMALFLVQSAGLHPGMTHLTVLTTGESELPGMEII